MTDEYSQDLFYGNIPYKNSTTSKLGYLSVFMSEFSKKIKDPYFIWTGTNDIEKLQEDIFSTKVLNKLRKRTIHFFLYEPGCYYNVKEDNFNRSFYSEFENNVNLQNIKCDAVDSIYKFSKKHNLKNIIIHTCDYNVELIQHHYPDIKLDCLDLFLREQAFYKKDRMSSLDTELIEHKFWCGNWRYTPHRHLIAAFMTNFDCQLSWHLDAGEQILKHANWIEHSNLLNHDKIIQGLKNLDNNNYSLDFNIPKWSVDELNTVTIPLDDAPVTYDDYEDFYRKCFCAIVNETRYAQPFANLSEKTLLPMLSLRPFILVAPPFSLEYLKTLGFKTFDNWWSEDYDITVSHTTRMMKIFNLIEQLNNKSINELKIMHQEMSEVLEHNKNLAQTLGEDFTPSLPTRSISN